MMVDIICPVALTANPKNGSYTSGAFARPYDLKIGTLKNTLQAVQPTMFIGVPRVWEKVRAAAPSRPARGARLWAGPARAWRRPGYLTT